MTKKNEKETVSDESAIVVFLREPPMSSWTRRSQKWVWVPPELDEVGQEAIQYAVEPNIMNEEYSGGGSIDQFVVKEFHPRTATAFRSFFDTIDAAEIRRDDALDHAERAVARLPEELPRELRRAAFALLAKPVWDEFRETQAAARRVMK